MRTFLLALLASLSLAACVAGPDDTGSTSSQEIGQCGPGNLPAGLEHVVIAPHAPSSQSSDTAPGVPSAAPIDPSAPAGAPGVPGAAPVATDDPEACQCADGGCIIAWMQKDLGCGLCADIQCADGRVLGGCLPCGEKIDQPSDDSTAPQACAGPVFHQ